LPILATKLGIAYVDLIGEIMRSATSRVTRSAGEIATL
jgi:hypothetical protein